MKRLKGLTAIFIGVFVLLLSLPSFSYGEEKVEGSASVSFMSSYVWRGIQLSDDEFVIQPSVGISYKGFSVNFWSNYNTDTTEEDETDYTLDFSNAIGKVGYSFGYIYYALSGASVEDSQEVYGAVSYDTILSPSLTIYRDFDEFLSTYVAFSIGHDFKVADFTVSSGASLSYYFYDNAEDDWQNFEVSLSTSIPVGNHFSIDPMVAYSAGLYEDESTGTELDDEFYGGVTVAFNF
jgi:uncharacterized protein (TIGR02001 family)